MPDPEIVEGDRAGSWLVRLDGRDQSVVDLLDPTRLAFDYVRRTGDVIDAAAAPGDPLRVVHVGGAGLTLPRYVATTRPRSWQVVLEPDEALTARVREELPLPRRSGVRVRPVAGRPGLEALRGAGADLVLVDAYDAGEVPADLVTAEALAVVLEVLAPTGTLVANLSDTAPFTLVRDVVAAASPLVEHVVLGAEPATLKGRRGGNVLLVAGPDGSLGDALRRRAASYAAPYRVLVGREVSDAFGGGAPRHDADPGPPGGVDSAG
ncbi:spermidine synthase [Nocardioides aurantiacus]|uniref:Spermidine synthase n=1 Tax=Nocardioides aurantiacus TaxID=86796 RepID=A0A3N2CXT6_9ACTN|nr:fused MFS/spermidine synthase [Nocardioides aurantiacus]ROR92345.1 hypothetical protein EDD33_3234 [Nocardioides aurantiacus]